MLQMVATLVTLFMLGGALSVIAITVRGNVGKIARALAGVPMTPVPPVPASAMRVTIRRPVRMIAPQPLRAAA